MKKPFRLFRKKKKTMVTFGVPKGAEGNTYYCGVGCMYAEFTPMEAGLYRFHFDEEGKLQVHKINTDNKVNPNYQLPPKV